LFLSEDLMVRLVLTFLSMGVWVTAIALATEKWGGKLGGFLVGIPSTSALSFFFTGLYVSPIAASNATNAFPVFLSLTGLMLLFFGFAVRRGFAFAIITSSMVWFFVCVLFIYLELDNFELSLIASTVFLVILYAGFRWWLRPRAQAQAKPKHTVPILVLRFVFGGSAVTMAVLMGQLGIPILSGMFAAFPALTISSLVAVHLNKENKGIERAGGMIMSMMISITVMCIPYSIAVHYLYPTLGIFYGTAMAFTVSLIVGISYYYLVEDYLVPSLHPMVDGHEGTGGYVNK
jgi:hypothetical protein